ncbi:hypothetical protein [Paracoccus aestuariivivens]|uniref:Uncharacterized protein n=1 Tax=Paracoccus aestuariivivens TaxID=1820333 RepID=A0A6L6JA26_9RHOB|nr:hypothetical protein [Paracoccus aestuariivivens]MTH79023.1 hypothetical protein [Paracoccus aestuariivivens]
MLWGIRELMKPALSVIDMIPNVHRTPAFAALRKAALDGRTSGMRLSVEEKELAFYDGPVQLVSPIGARLLRALYREGRIKLKKPAVARLPALDAYIATEAAFRAEVARILLDEDQKRERLALIMQDPSVARPDELTPYLVDKVITVRLGHGVYGSLLIAGLMCHKALILTPETENHQIRAEGRVVCWWMDQDGNRQGDPE